MIKVCLLVIITLSSIFLIGCDSLEDHDVNEVIKYIKALSQHSAGSEKIKVYFPDGPLAEIVSK